MSEQIRIVYDKECPACHAYCRLAKANAGPEEVVLIDARDKSDLMEEITNRGLDIDEGMVVAVGGELHYGADAIHILARVQQEKTLFNHANRLLFKKARIARLLYPLLRAVRNFLLKLLGVKRINNLNQPGNDKF